MTDSYKGTIIWDRDGKLKGVATGSTHPCQQDGCRGSRISVRWPDGTHTYPCGKGLTGRPDGSFQIM